jgi:hypothetical protein
MIQIISLICTYPYPLNEDRESRGIGENKRNSRGYTKTQVSRNGSKYQTVQVS